MCGIDIIPRKCYLCSAPKIFKMNKLTDIIKRNGIQGCLQKVIFRTGKCLGFTYIQYFAYFKNLPERMDADLLPSYQKMTMNDFRKQTEFDEAWFNSKKLKQIEGFIDEPGFSYYGIYDNDKLMCYGAISMDYDNFINRKMDPNAAYLFDDYTNPRYRGKGLHQQIVELREYEAWKQNKSIAFAYVSSSNYASAKGFKRCGYIVKIKLIYKQMGKSKPLKREFIKI